VLNTLNTRLDATALAFMLDHGEAKVLITDREFAPTIRRALELAKVKPLVIDYDDREFPQTGELLGSIEYERFIADGDPEFTWVPPKDEWDAIKRVEEFFKPLKAMADQLHKALCSREREILEPLRSADVAKVDAIKRYHLTEQRERQRRQDAEAEARRRDDQDRAAIEAARLEEQGEHALAAAVVEEAIAAPTPVVVYPDPVAAVVSFTRRWKWKYQHGPADITKTPPQLVARALALVPKEFLCLDEKKVGAYARSMKTTGHIPGIDIYAVDEPNR
jgi:hypothetical protein